MDVKDDAASTSGYILPRGVYQMTDINLMFLSLLPADVKLNFAFDDIRLRSKLTI